MHGEQRHDESPAPRRPGRPPDERRRAAILAAAGDLMFEGGLAAATMEAIAARAGVSKQTIYNRWPSRGAVALEGFMVRADPLGQVPPDATAAQALHILARALVRLFASHPAGPLMRSLIADAQTSPEMAEALRSQWLDPRRESVVDILRRGIERGELRADLDIPAALDHAFAPVYYRLLLGHEPLDDDAAARSIEMLLHGISRE